MMKKQLFLLLLSFGFTLSLFAQKNPISQRFTLYGSFGLQYYKGDLGNGFYKTTENCNYAVASIGLDYRLNKALDLKFFATRGSLGYLQPDNQQADITPPPYEQILNPPHHHHDNDLHHHAHSHAETHQHGIDPDTENLSSRLSAGVVALQYRFANGHVLPLESKFVPAIYAGIGLNYLSDPMKMECVKTGFYTTINTGASFNYKITPSLQMGVKVDFGVFTSDNIDFIRQGGNDLHMQNAIAVGYSF